MERDLQRWFRSGLVGLACTAIAACGGGGASPGLKFKLGAVGLPQSDMWKSTPALADINGDGLMDLAAHPRLGHGAQVWLGNGQGVWTDASQGLGFPSFISCGGDVAFGDINKDGRLDLAVADHCRGVFVYLGDGQDHWKVSTQGLTPELARQTSLPKFERGTLQGAEDVALGDVNEDGFLDMVVASSDKGGLSVYFGDGSGTSWKEAHADGLPSSDDPELDDGQLGGWANEVLLYDVNGDGHLDVVASYRAVT